VTDTQNKYEVSLSLGSWVYLAGVLGLSSGFVVGVVSAVVAVYRSGWEEALLVLFLSAPLGALSLAVYAVLSYPIYKYLVARTPDARTLRGVFRRAFEGNEEDVP
jgi:hypothetical protein